MKNPYAHFATFDELPEAVKAAVNAYDNARCKLYGRNDRPMSDANKLSIAPMIAYAIEAFRTKAAEDAGLL